MKLIGLLFVMTLKMLSMKMLVTMTIIKTTCQWYVAGLQAGWPWWRLEGHGRCGPHRNISPLCEDVDIVWKVNNTSIVNLQGLPCVGMAFQCYQCSVENRVFVWNVLWNLHKIFIINNLAIIIVIMMVIIAIMIMISIIITASSAAVQMPELVAISINACIPLCP